MTPTPPRLLREPEVISLTGYSRASIRRLAKAGTFPAPLKLSPAPGGAVAWRADEVQAWIESRCRAGGAAPGVARE